MRRSAVSIYGYRCSGIKPIYGCKAPVVTMVSYDNEHNCECEPAISPLIALQNLLNFLTAFQSTLSSYYVTENVNAPLSAKMTVSGTMKFRLFSRLVWGRTYTGHKFDRTNQTHLNGLKDIYLAYNQDWSNDPFLCAAAPTTH